MAAELDEVKLQVAQANRILSDVGLAIGVTSALGHASMRLPSQPDRFVVKGRQYALDALTIMRPEDMVVCDTEGFLVGGPPGIMIVPAKTAMRLDEIGFSGAPAVAASLCARMTPSGDAKRASECTSAARSE